MTGAMAQRCHSIVFFPCQTPLRDVPPWGPKMPQRSASHLPVMELSMGDRVGALPDAAA